MFPKLQTPKKLIYLDYAAATPLDPAVKKAMEPYLRARFGNPSGLYKQGIEARQAVEGSRKKIADMIGARASEIIFTAGGTESCNLAIFGTARNHAESSAEKRGRPHIIVSAIEHHAVLNPAKALAGEGYALTILDVDCHGFVNIEEIKKAIRPETVLVSVMFANNEIGTLEPIAEIGKCLSRINTEREQNELTRIVFHTDACQAAGFLDINVNRLGVDLMSVNGSKIYGPKQTGFLYVREGIKLKPLVYGGGQERGLRSGTQNVAGIVGLARALELAQDGKTTELEIKRISRLQNYFIAKLLKIPGVELNGPHDHRLPNNINVTIKDVEGEVLLLYLDSYGIAVSTGSACSTGSSDASHVLLAVGLSEKQAKSSLRFSLGKSTTKGDLEYALKILPTVIYELRKIKH